MPTRLLAVLLRSSLKVTENIPITLNTFFPLHLNFAISLCRIFSAFKFRAFSSLAIGFLFLLVPQTNSIIEISPVLLFTLYNCISYHGRIDNLCRQNYGDGQLQKFA